MLKGPDGREYRVLSKGRYKAFYDTGGRVDRLEFDSNGDGKTDQVAFYDGAASPRRVTISIRRAATTRLINPRTGQRKL